MTTTQTAPETTTLDANALGAAAVAKLLAKEPTVKGFSLEPGRYEVDTVITLKVTGQVLKSEDGEYTPTADIPLVPTLALLLQRAGITREASEALIIECATAALEAGDEVKGEMEDRIKDAKETLAALQARLSVKLPKKTRKGATKFTGRLDIQNQTATATVIE